MVEEGVTLVLVITKSFEVDFTIIIGSLFVFKMVEDKVLTRKSLHLLNIPFFTRYSLYSLSLFKPPFLVSVRNSPLSQSCTDTNV